MAPGAETLRIKEEDYEIKEQVEESGFKWTEYSYEIPEQFDKTEFISINTELNEYGQKHWQMFSFKFLAPADGLKIDLRCDSDLIIKYYMIFDKDKYYATSISEDKKHFTLICNQWMKPGVGLSILVAKQSTDVPQMPKIEEQRAA
jgi:hypothetical protein